MTRGGFALIGLSCAALVGSCATAPAQEASSPKAAERLAKELAGRSPGTPVDCIRNFKTTDMQVIDDWTILFREGSTVYLQKPDGGCNGLSNGSRTLVTKRFGTSDLCRGDINQLVDLRSGVGGGSCVFTRFVPYTRSAS